MAKSKLSVLAAALSEKSGLSTEDAEKFIKQMFDVANNVLQHDKQLKVKWLGTFKVQTVKDRESVDVNTGERIVIESREKLSFTPDSVLKEIVNKPFAQFETVVINEGSDFSEIDDKYAHMEEEVLQDKDKVDSDETSHSTDVLASMDKQEDESSTNIEAETGEDNPMQGVHVFGDEYSSDEPSSNVSPSAEVVVISDFVNPHPEEVKETDTPVQEMSHEEVSINSESIKQATIEQVDDSDSSSHHLIIPKYVLIVAAVIFVVLIGGGCWFAFHYGKISALHDHLISMSNSEDVTQKTLSSGKTASKTPQQKNNQVLLQDSAQRVLAKKAKQDSIRMEEANKAVKMAEEAEALKKQSQKVETLKEKEAAKKDNESIADKQLTSSKYDSDPRVRTGAYRIVGVAQTVTVKSGQSLANISKLYLGPGMECYVEALNPGNGEVKAGQKIKIPKLELKKKK